ncbi:restriction endonuclease subunit M [Spirochaetia bacterium]|nr:restriction endonuclease subunit M [Spirochaetia bacterium]
MARYWLVENNREETYINYLKNLITRGELYKLVPEKIISSVINTEIGEDTLSEIFSDINEINGNKKIDLIIGGPPCQAYSLVGRSRDSKKMVGDKRNYLYKYYAKFLEKYQPEYFLFENVLGLLSAKDESNNCYLDDMKKVFGDIGYTVETKKISAVDFGVLQNRERIILVGRLKGNALQYPEPEKWNPGRVCVREIFRDLPFLKSGKGKIGPCKTKKYDRSYLYDAGIKDDIFPVTLHQARPNTEQDLEIYRLVVELWNKEKKRLDYNMLPNYLKTHNNRDAFTDRFKVVAANLKYSHTVVAHIAKDGHYYIHPNIKQNRSITPREAARLQTFPDDFYFETDSGIPGRSAAFRQIGNAVPVLMAERIAKKLLEVW